MATVNTSTIGSGSAGSITINAFDLEIRNRVSSSAIIPDSDTQKVFGVPSVPSGSPGEVNINTGNLRITDGGQVSVSNEGTSTDAGRLTINARSITLDNKSSITTATASGEGGNIKINTQNLQLRNSTISATAEGNGNGGNIKINTQILTGSENSSIKANAFEGRGGNIQINARGLFLSPDSFITTRSQLGVDGTVQINSFNVNPAGIKAAPEIVTETPNMVSGCAAQSGTGSDMLIVASNSPPPKFDEHLDSQPIWQKNSVSSKSDELSSKLQLSIIKETTEIVEAQSWIIDSRGNVELVAIAPNQATPDSFFSTIPCTSVDSVAELSYPATQ
ncbi:S-layer family protein [Nostoc sp. FACHB-892]|uniref:S-layer family protein n=1 Tax=Nostoc sp. FACHB-892 TaxID=2692843 RepID=UPI001689E7AE|nr:S-layer family protein [Nostoc sp. FACHB-892]MBD2732081.1 S-layer family protein [Nostoc sp. FACHB-892]